MDTLLFLVEIIFLCTNGSHFSESFVIKRDPGRREYGLILVEIFERPVVFNRA